MSETSVPFESSFKRDCASQKICFLCGTELEDGKFTKEHIFPQWILKKFQLWDKRITLLNRIPFPYRTSIVPYCNKCNNDHLSKLENEIKVGVEKGYHYFKVHVPLIRIYQWCQLLFYKWLYKETFLKPDLKNSASEKIVPEYNCAQMTMNQLAQGYFFNSFVKHTNNHPRAKKHTYVHSFSNTQKGK